MRRELLLLLGCALPLAACSSTPSSVEATPGQPRPEVAGGGGQCRPDGLPALVGRTASQDVIDAAVRDAGARTARVVKPGMAVTMDYREDRITISVDANNRIERASCG